MSHFKCGSGICMWCFGWGLTNRVTEREAIVATIWRWSRRSRRLHHFQALWMGHRHEEWAFLAILHPVEEERLAPMSLRGTRYKIRKRDFRLAGKDPLTRNSHVLSLTLSPWPWHLAWRPWGSCGFQSMKVCKASLSKLSPLSVT